MRSFKDRMGMEWQIEITIGTSIEFKDRLGLDLDASEQICCPHCKHLLYEENGLLKVSNNSNLLFKALYVACEAQAIERNLTAKAFYALFSDDSITSANRAFIEALIDFFPNARRRESLTRLVESLRAIEEKNLDQSEKAADRLEEMLTAPEPDADSGNASGATPESAASQEPNSAA
ncbi:MAG: hypothetical protein WC374_11780 [Phycisphaerae bacterium]